MSEELLLKHCSPTLAGIKTGNMFACNYGNVYEMRNSVRFWNKTLSGKGIRIIPLRYDGKRALIYIYRPSRLKADLINKKASDILRSCGYREKNAEECIVRLLKRISELENFPHEIGLFLGYPPEDVYGFIENKAENFKYLGCWKVYGNVQSAQKIFEKYKKCTDVYCSKYANGRSIDLLTVAG